ncbi:hypothetical protein ANCDUO_00701 [Ancylostoma duodenale]|uniref:Uncharacterized protein n=1 Tax=Ancylostoma duodenale TaxID=51022 RepID=A0A0C2DG63_9BILA|nr:hypothetical protein ANCDUO_00701 [Ancylostoma duodenale]
MQFDNANAPFLRSVPPDVRRKFEKVWNDEDLPSESLRTLKIQTLAVSLLTAKQLEEYNRWATKRRYVLKAREHELRQLSSDAKRTLRRMSTRGNGDVQFPGRVVRAPAPYPQFSEQWNSNVPGTRAARLPAFFVSRRLADARPWDSPSECFSVEPSRLFVFNTIAVKQLRKRDKIVPRSSA